MPLPSPSSSFSFTFYLYLQVDTPPPPFRPKRQVRMRMLIYLLGPEYLGEGGRMDPDASTFCQHVQSLKVCLKSTL